MAKADPQVVALNAAVRDVVAELRKRFVASQTTLRKGELYGLVSVVSPGKYSAVVEVLKHRGMIAAPDTHPTLVKLFREEWGITAAVMDDGKQPNPDAGDHGGKAGESKSLRPCDQKAFSQYQHAVEQEPTLTSDDAAYDWLVDDGKDDGIQLPRRDSWKRMLGRARAFYDQRKNGPRIGNETRSVVSAKRLDAPKRTKTDQR